MTYELNGISFNNGNSTIPIKIVDEFKCGVYLCYKNCYMKHDNRLCFEEGKFYYLFWDDCAEQYYFLDESYDVNNESSMYHYVGDEFWEINDEFEFMRAYFYKVVEDYKCGNIE